MGIVAVAFLEVVIRRALLIVNPASRRGNRDLGRVEAAFAALGVACDTRLTTAPGHATSIARACAGDYDAVFTLGGDGTILETLGGLLDVETPLGPLAAGTGNLVARAFGVPLDPARAVRVLCAGHVRTVDLGQLRSGAHFVVAAGIGIDVAMLERTSAALKRRLGVTGYVYTGAAAAIRAAVHRETFQARITVDDVSHDVEALSLMVTNLGAVLNGIITLAPGGAPDDGLLDVVVYAPRNLAEALRVAWRMLRGAFPDDGLVRFYRGRHIRVVTEPAHRAQADGELLPLGEFEVQVMPGAGRFLVPGRF